MKKNTIKIKNCTFQDSKFIQNLYNDNVKKKKFNNNKIVSLKSHQKWMRDILKSKKSKIYIGCLSEKFGYVRIENLFENMFSVSIAVTERYMGKGYSSAFLNLSMEKFFRKKKNFILFSFVKKNNLRSKNFFQSNNFLEIKKNNKNKLKQFTRNDNNIFIYFKQFSCKKYHNKND
tara:strand:- start:336 stop:860 length:525 start_codon:yes stop_codon:yes gene_type:complete